MKKNKLLAHALISGVLATLTACGPGSIGIPVGPTPLTRASDGRLAALQAEIDRYCLGNSSRASAADTGSTNTVNQTSPFGLANYNQERRNHVVTAFMFASDDAYNIYEARLLDIIRRDALGISTLSMMLSTMATTVQGHADLVRSLSAANTVVTGTSAAIGRDYLMNQTLTTMLTQMRANRSRQRALILGRLGNTMAEWPLCVALSDARAFEQAGTLTEALVRTSEAAATENREADQAVRNAIRTTAYVRTPMMTGLRAYLFPVGNDTLAQQRLTEARTILVNRGFGDQTIRNLPDRFSEFLARAPETEIRALIEALADKETVEAEKVVLRSLIAQ